MVRNWKNVKNKTDMKKTHLRQASQILIISLLLGFLVTQCKNSDKLSYDIIIKNGIVIDGSGSQSINTDIGIIDDKIIKLGNLKSHSAKKVIDAEGLIVAPGFIDLHTHCDWGLGNEETRANLNYLIQGVTSVVTGNCGYGTDEISNFKINLENSGIGNNAIPLTGFGFIRNKVLGNIDREPDATELQSMKDIIKNAMEQGSWGLSSGLQYVPGKFASTSEIVELSKIVSSFDGIYSSHMRSEENELVEAVDETLIIGKESGVNVNIAHLKANGKSNFLAMRTVIDMVEKARQDGMEVTADMYPYDKSATTPLYSVLLYPEEYKGLDEIKAALLDKKTKERIRKLTETGIPGQVNWVAKGGWNFFSIVKVPGHPELSNKMFCDLAKETGKSEFDIAAELIIEGGEKVIISLSTMNEDNLKKQLEQDWVMVSSDGSSVEFGTEGVHPRNYGSNARVIRKYVREEKILSLEEAIRKMSGLPAETLGLINRGLIREGYFADIVVFDFDKIYDRATFLDPNHYSEGVDYVLVNGNISIEMGEFMDEYAGQVLLKIDSL